jgi:hypothetical protein
LVVDLRMIILKTNRITNNKLSTKSTKATKKVICKTTAQTRHPIFDNKLRTLVIFRAFRVFRGQKKNYSYSESFTGRE